MVYQDERKAERVGRNKKQCIFRDLSGRKEGRKAGVKGTKKKKNRISFRLSYVRGLSERKAGK